MVFKNFLSKSKEVDILSNLPDGTILIDCNGKIGWANEVFGYMFELSKNESLKYNINELIEGGLELAKQAAQSAKSVVGRAKSQLDKEFYTEITARYVDEYIMISLRDVTQNYKTVTSILVEHESSRKVNKDKNTFLVQLSNELKSPIHSILGFSQAMIDGLGGDMSDKQEKYIKIINKNSNDILYLMDKILELSKTESNLFEYDFQIFDALNSMHTVLKNYEAQIGAKSLNVTFDSEDVVKRTIFSDENAFKVIIQNILETAIKSTDIGSISIKAHHPDLDFVAQQDINVPEGASDKSFMMITVSDTGAGVAEADLNVIFEPYAQLDRANKKNIVRSIALASVKNIVKYLKGDVWIESEPMHGTTYNVILPIEKFAQ